MCILLAFLTGGTGFGAGTTGFGTATTGFGAGATNTGIRIILLIGIKGKINGN